MGRYWKKSVATAVGVALSASLFACGEESARVILPEDPVVRAAVLYDGDSLDKSWQDTYSHLEQSLLLNFTASAVDVSKGCSLDGYDVIYPDETVMESKNSGEVKAQIYEFTKDGGAVFLTNGFYSFFDPEFTGAKSFVKLSGCPGDLEITKAGGDLAELQGIISDFASLYASYSDYDRLSQYDYGYAVVPGSAKALVKSGGLALYTMNSYGRGYVFFTNPLLPNRYSINGFSLASRDEAQVSLACTTASANQLIENAFASFAMKKRYGFSVWRVFGCFGRPSMAWELHLEEISGIANNSAVIFGDMCKEHNQIPSYSIVRNAFSWFKRAESITYLLGGSGGAMEFEPDFNEGAYSSGTHVVSGGKWLSLASVEDAGSYFVDYPQYGQRAYPCVFDLNGDGNWDIISGSSDGRFYFSEGEGFSDRLVTKKAETLKNEAGADLRVAGYSAPVLADIDGDGLVDIVSGSSDGNIYLFSGAGGAVFRPEGVLLRTGISGCTLPDIGDLNGDGTPDLLVGSNAGVLRAYYGRRGDKLSFSEDNMADISAACAGLGDFLSPRIADLNGDGTPDIAVGTFDGYIAKLIMEDGGLRLDGYITTGEMNYKGNFNVKFGNNCVPFFADINLDGKTDLIAGFLEYGLAYPIDSRYFPYREKLQEQIDYMKANYFYAGAHFYTNAYASKDREMYELKAHIAALGTYGLEARGLGTNAHTWYLSGFSPTQTFLSIYSSGLLWDSGFMPPNSAATPQVSAENAIALPFFLTADGNRTLLVQNCSTLLYSEDGWTDISAKYGMPMCIYYHCDFVYRSQDDALSAIQKAAAFQDRHAYNFVTEEQMMKATAAAYNLVVTLSNGPNAADGLDIVLRPGAASTGFPLYDGDYQRSCGVRIDFGEAFDAGRISTDADVWYRDGNSLFISLNRDVRVYRSDGRVADTPHLERVNIAADVRETEGGAEIRFLDDGMMQAIVSGEAGTSSPGWDVAKRGGKTIFTKFGAAETLEVKYS